MTTFIAARSGFERVLLGAALLVLAPQASSADGPLVIEEKALSVEIEGHATTVKRLNETCSPD